MYCENGYCVVQEIMPPFMWYHCFNVLLVAKRKSLFDDKPEEIQQLTFIVKQDIASLNKQIAQLQEVSDAWQSSSMNLILKTYYLDWNQECFTEGSHCVNKTAGSHSGELSELCKSLYMIQSMHITQLNSLVVTEGIFNIWPCIMVVWRSRAGHWLV